jgi:hypothetical protein
MNHELKKDGANVRHYIDGEHIGVIALDDLPAYRAQWGGALPPLPHGKKGQAEAALPHKVRPVKPGQARKRR